MEVGIRRPLQCVSEAALDTGRIGKGCGHKGRARLRLGKLILAILFFPAEYGERLEWPPAAELPRRGGNRRSGGGDGGPAPGIPAPRDRYGRYASPALGPIQTRQRRRAGARPLPVPANPLACLPPLSPPSPPFSTWGGRRVSSLPGAAQPRARPRSAGGAGTRGAGGGGSGGSASLPSPRAGSARTKSSPHPSLPPPHVGSEAAPLAPPPAASDRPDGAPAAAVRPMGAALGARQWARWRLGRRVWRSVREGESGSRRRREAERERRAELAAAPAGAAAARSRGGGGTGEWAGERATPRGLNAAAAPGAAIYTRVLCHGGGEEGRGRQGGMGGWGQRRRLLLRSSRPPASPSRGAPAGRHARSRPVTAGGGRHGVWSALCLSWLRPARPAAPIPARRGADPGWGRARRHSSEGRGAAGGWRAGTRGRPGDSLSPPLRSSRRHAAAAPARAEGGVYVCARMCASPAHAGRGKSVCPPWAARHAARLSPPGRLGQVRPGSRKPGRAGRGGWARPGPPARTRGTAGLGWGLPPRLWGAPGSERELRRGQGGTQSGGRSGELPNRGGHRAIPIFQNAARKFINSWKFWGFGSNIGNHGNTEHLKSKVSGEVRRRVLGWAVHEQQMCDRISIQSRKKTPKPHVLWHHAHLFNIARSLRGFQNCYSYTKEKQCVHRCAAGMG